MPKIYYDKLQEFFQTLTTLGILDANRDIIEKVQDAVNSTISKNPTI
jgi:hypothetical protein